MVGLGTLIDTVAVIIGGFLGLLTGHIFKQNQQEAVIKTCGVSVLFMAIASAMQGMLRIQHGELIAGRTLFIILTLAVGTILIFSIGINLIWGKMLRVANMLPALVLAVCTSYVLPLFAGWF